MGFLSGVTSFVRHTVGAVDHAVGATEKTVVGAAKGTWHDVQDGFDWTMDKAGGAASHAWNAGTQVVERNAVVAGDRAMRTAQDFNIARREGTSTPTLGTANPNAGNGKPPVILLAGQGDDAGKTMQVYANSLKRDGFKVFIFNDSNHAMESHGDASKGLDKLVDQVRAQTGAAKVDLVGYSTGATNARAYTNLYGGAGKVDRVVQLAGTNNGDPTAFGFCQSGLEEKKGSQFMKDLNSHPSNVPVYSIFEKGTDGNVEESDARLPDSPLNHNIALPQAQHGGGSLPLTDHVNLPFDARAYEQVVGALTAE